MYVRSITRSTVYQLAGTGVWKISFVVCGFSSIKVDYSVYLKSLINRINEVDILSIKYRFCDILLKKHKLHLSRLFCCNHTCYCVNMVSVTSVLLYITSVSRYHPRYQSRSSIRPWSDSTEFRGIGLGSSDWLNSWSLLILL